MSVFYIGPRPNPLKWTQRKFRGTIYGARCSEIAKKYPPLREDKNKKLAAA